ncbi:MAG: hypothetical protein HYY26_03360 [Acidobacteria bacterium]|nr:hypothetical protein [Acidobacteriota bacterium]
MVARAALALALAALVAPPAFAWPWSKSKDETKLTVDAGAELKWEPAKDRGFRLRVTKVKRNSEAEEMGYKKGDEIIAIDRQPIGRKTLEEVFALSRQAESFTVRRKDQTLEMPVLFRVGVAY